MDKKEEKEFGRAWALLLVGSILAFVIGIAANAFYSLITVDNKSWKVFAIFIVSFGLFLFIARYLSFAFENLKEFKKMSDWEFFRFWRKRRNRK